MYAGIDPSASAQKPSGLVLLSSQGEWIEGALLHTDEDLLSRLQTSPPIRAVGLDAPVSLPFGMGLCCLANPPLCDCALTSMRHCERAVMKQGYALYPLTKNAFPAAKAWALRGLLLALRIQTLGVPYAEVYPSACKRRLFSAVAWIKPKSKRAARAQLQTLLANRVIGLPRPDEKLLSDHVLDALLAAYTVFLEGEWGEGERLGQAGEGDILLPPIMD